MKHYLITAILLFGFCWQTYAQDLCPMHENVLILHYGGIWQNDEYLSPLLYSGQTFGLSNEWWSELTTDWRHVGKVQINGAFTDNNRAIQNSQMAFGVNGGWGALYDFRKIINVEGLNVFVGPYLHFDFMGRNISSYVNKPFSMDLSGNIRLYTGISYTIPCAKSAYRLQYHIMTDFIGLMFVPDYWQSYYEMERSLAGTVAFSSLLNRQSLTHELLVDMQFKRSTWRVGVRHEYLQYTANNLHFSREQVCLVIGTVFNYKLSKTPLK